MAVEKRAPPDNSGQQGSPPLGATLPHHAGIKKGGRQPAPPLIYPNPGKAGRYIMPPIPPMPGSGIAGIADLSSGLSVMRHSVVSIRPETEAAF